MGCRSVQVQLNIGLYAKSSYRGFLVAPYDSVSAPGGCAAREPRPSNPNTSKEVHRSTLDTHHGSGCCW